MKPSADRIKYDSRSMAGRTEKDKENIIKVLSTGRKLYIDLLGTELRAIDSGCFIGIAVKKRALLFDF